MAYQAEINSPRNEAIETNFSYHSVDPVRVEDMGYIRAKAKELAYVINDLCLDSREKSLAMTNLEQAVMWADASIARH